MKLLIILLAGALTLLVMLGCSSIRWTGQPVPPPEPCIMFGGECIP